MSQVSRRQLLAGFLGGLVQASGTVVLARAVFSEGTAQGKEASAAPASQASLQERADRVASGQPTPDEEEFHPVSFINGGFRNGGFVNGGGGFRNGGFANGGGGGFRNTGFANGGGGFRNGGFANGGGGGFRNGAFRNY